MERKGEDRSDRGVLHARVRTQVGCHEVLAPVHHPARDAEDVWFHVGCQAAIRQDRRLPQQIRGDDGPARGRHPGGGSFDDELGDLVGLERGVHRANHVEQRVALLDADPQRALKHAQLRREIEARHRQRTFAGATWLRSAFSDRADGSIQGNRHADVTASLACKYTTRPSVTACHAVSSWRTMGVCQRCCHDHARPDAPAQELAQVEPRLRRAGAGDFFHSQLPPAEPCGRHLGRNGRHDRGAGHHRGRIPADVRRSAAGVP